MKLIATKTTGKFYVKEKQIDGTWKNKYLGKIKGWRDPKTGIKNQDGLLKREAEELKTVLESKALNNKHDHVLRDVDITIKDALNEFLKTNLYRGTRALKLSEGSKRLYNTAVVHMGKWFDKIGIKKLSSLKLVHVNGFTVDNNELAIKTLHERQKILIRFLRWAGTRGYWKYAQDLETVKRIPKVRKPPKFLSMDQLHAFFDNAPKKYKNAFQFMYYVGARVSDVGFITWNDYNKEKGLLTFTVNEGSKTKRITEVFINQKAKDIIEAQRALNHGSPYIFTNTTGGRLTGRNLREAMKRVFKKLDIDASSHILRHTFASQLATNGVRLVVLKELMRHANIEETMIYAHLTDDAQRTAIEKLPI